MTDLSLKQVNEFYKIMWLINCVYKKKTIFTYNYRSFMLHTAFKTIKLITIKFNKVSKTNSTFKNNRKYTIYPYNSLLIFKYKNSTLNISLSIVMLNKRSVRCRNWLTWVTSSVRDTQPLYHATLEVSIYKELLNPCKLFAENLFISPIFVETYKQLNKSWNIYFKSVFHII